MPEDLNKLWQTYLYLSTLKAQNNLTPEEVTQWQQTQDALKAADPQAVQDAFSKLDPQQQQQLNALDKPTQQAAGGGNYVPPGAAAPGVGSIAPGPDGKYTSEQVGQIIASLATGGAGGGGGNLSIAEQTAQRMRGASQQRMTAVTYQDLPTPEEYMNQWDNAFAAHVNGLVQSGAISPEAAEFARSQTGQFYGDYVRAQLADVLKGNPLFKVVGLTPDNKLIGARQGAYEAGTYGEQQQQQYNLQQQSTGGGTVGELALDNILRGVPGPNIGVAAGVRAIAGAGGGGGSLSLTDVGTTDTLMNQLQSTQEGIVQRNKLGVVANLAPLDFLTQGVNAQRINMLYAGQKGTAARASQTALGEAPGVEVRRQ